MELTITPEIESIIQRKVASGEYETPQQALESAVYRLEAEADALSGWSAAEWQSAIDAGLESEAREALVAPDQARAHLVRVRSGLISG